jgi:hypothetical protein
LVIKSEGEYVWRPTVFFHPNLREDGYKDLRLTWVLNRSLWDTGKHYGELARERRVREGVTETKEEREHRVKYDRPFPNLPENPHFWDHPATGSSVFLWPPRCFKDWVEQVKAGGSLTFDPAPSKVAGSSKVCTFLLLASSFVSLHLSHSLFSFL